MSARSPALARPWSTGSLTRVPQLCMALGARSALCHRAGLGPSMSPGGQEAAVLCMVDVRGKSEPCLTGKEERVLAVLGQQQWWLLAGRNVCLRRDSWRRMSSLRRTGQSRAQATPPRSTAAAHWRLPHQDPAETHWAQAPRAAGSESVALGWPLLRTATSI